MNLISPQSALVHRRVRGREKRNITLNTKLTRAEFAEVERFCELQGFAFGEWLRDIVLREVRDQKSSFSPMALMGEIAGLRLLFINTLEPIARGEKMSSEQFKEMLRYVKANKRRAAADALASYAEGTTEQP